MSQFKVADRAYQAGTVFPAGDNTDELAFQRLMG